MAHYSVWYETKIPAEMVDMIEQAALDFDSSMGQSKVGGSGEGALVEEIRRSENAWIPANHWIGSFCLNYVNRANRENFNYDVSGFDGENMQYTRYGEGQYYNWHQDADVGQCATFGCGRDTSGADYVARNSEIIRKLSFVLQLSEYDEYTGGELQFHHAGETWFAPRRRGVITIFDSRVMHRVKRVRSGIRKSLVGWTVGPRWK